MHLMHPWTPLALTEEGGTVRTSVYGRTYTADARSPFASILSQGTELLAAPMRLQIREDGEDYTLEKVSVRGGWIQPPDPTTVELMELRCRADRAEERLSELEGLFDTNSLNFII